MKKKALAGILALLMIASPLGRAEAAGAGDKLLELYLQTYENERNAKIAEQKITQTQAKIEALQKSEKESQAKADAARKRAGKTLAAIYTGERGNWWGAILEAKSLKEVLALADFLKLLFERDREALSGHQEAQKALAEKEAALRSEEGALSSAQSKYAKRLEELRVQKPELEKLFAASGSSEEARSSLAKLANNWEFKGLPDFRMFFGTLANSLSDLPSLLKKENIKSKSLLSRTVVVKEEELNRLLREKNPLFNDLKFAFEEDKMIASGTHGGLSLRMEGAYELNGEGGIAFRIDKLSFEGVALPDSTIEDLQEQFYLGFNPSELVPGARVSRIETRKGEIELVIGL